jgi:signal transduction histidine kinase
MVLPLGAVIVLFTVVTVLGVSLRDQLNARESLAVHVRLTAAIAAGGAADALWDYDKEALTAALAALAADADYVGSNVVDDQGRLIVADGSDVTEGDRIVSAREPIIKISHGDTQKIGMLTLRMSTARAEAETTQATEMVVAIGAAALLVICGLVIMIVRNTTRPILRLTETMAKLSRGDLASPIPALDRHDEIGRMAAAVEVFKQNALEVVRLNVEQARLKEEAERRRAQEEADKMAALGTLVAGVAHEVNTPLGIAITATSALSERLDRIESAFRAGTLTEDQLTGFIAAGREAIRLATENLERAVKLVRSFKQVAVDQNVEEPRYVALKPYLEDVLLSLRHELKRGQHLLTITGEDDVGLEIVPSQLWQVVSNLVLNAVIHAFPDRKGGHIEITVRRDDVCIVIEVRDDGIGMEPEVARRCFEPFFTTRRGQGGSGLGLSIVHNLVTGAMRGTITLKSEPGVGSSFILRLDPARPIRGLLPAPRPRGEA